MKKMKNKKKFWNFVQKETERTLYISGEIVDGEDFGIHDNETKKSTADIFREELYSGKGNVSVWINSPGGDMFVGAQIYNLLKNYEGETTVKIDGIAASAASIIAMAGDKILMSPVSQLMIHNPFACAEGDSLEMKRAAEMLSEVKESAINAYALKTHLSRNKISKMMDDETWMNAYKALDLGFADGVLFENDKDDNEDDENTEEQKPKNEAFMFSRKSAIQSVMNKVKKQFKLEDNKVTEKQKISIEPLYRRLDLLKRR